MALWGPITHQAGPACSQKCPSSFCLLSFLAQLVSFHKPEIDRNKDNTEAGSVAVNIVQILAATAATPSTVTMEEGAKMQII